MTTALQGPLAQVSQKQAKVLLCHNFYQQSGGEDRVFNDEARLLEAKGHQVRRFTVHNDSIPNMSGIGVALRCLWNGQVYRELRRLLRSEHPDVIHFTNTFPLISPAAYYAAKAEGVAVVQSLHNYRLLCCNSLLHRNGRVCESCLDKIWPWPGLRYGCYRDSRIATSVVTLMITLHRLIGTWRRKVDRYIALSEFSRQKFIQGGLPSDRIVVKPNFVIPDPGVGQGGPGAVYVGRLSAEKGIDVLLQAWERLGGRYPLQIVGDGPLADQVRAASTAIPGIVYLGRRTPEEVASIIGQSRCLILPSTCYENFPKTLLEAYAAGTPVIASQLGAMAELVLPGRTGLVFDAGKPASLAEAVERLFADPSADSTLRQFARRVFEERYTAEANYLQLIAIYREAMARLTPAMI